MKRTGQRRRPERIAEVGAIYTFREGDRVGACQVIAGGKSAKTSDVEIATLDWLGPRPPTPKDKLTILRATWGSWNGRPDRCRVEPRVPWWLERAFTTDVIEVFDEPCSTHGGWQSARGAFLREAWKARPKRRKSGSGEVAVDIGGGPRTVRKSAWYLTIGEGEWVVPRPKGKPRFEALDVLTELSEVHFDGACAALPAWVATRAIATLDWTMPGATKIDLSKTTLTDLRIDVTSDTVLRVPPTLGTLTLRGEPERAKVEGIDGRFPFRLTVSGKRIVAPRGVASVACVTFADLVETDTAALAAFPALKELSLRGAPGTIRDASGFAALDGVREIELHDVYGLDAARFPTAWPTLDAVTVHGVEKTEAERLKAVFAEVPTVRITGARTKAWMETNLGNPFREWEDDDEDFGRAACAAWKKAKVAVTKLGPKAKKKDAETALEAFVGALNRLDGKHGEMNTIRREEACDAFLDLARECGVDDGVAEKWFDGWRDF